MKIEELAWLIIRAVGLVLLIFSLRFGIGFSIGAYFANEHSDYSWVEPGEEEGTNVPVKRRNLHLCRQYSQIAADNGIPFFVMIGAGLYLILGGKFIHRILTRRPPRNPTSNGGTGRD